MGHGDNDEREHRLTGRSSGMHISLPCGKTSSCVTCDAKTLK